MLDLDTLRQRCAEGQTYEYLYFWGHQPSRTGLVTKSCFSQWYASSFAVDGKLYPTAEHWMMAAKARLFGDDESLIAILDADSPREAKAIGREVRDFDEATWTDNARKLVTEGNIAKFEQNDQIRKFLIGTGDAVLVEASPYDRIWGIGLKVDDARAKYPDTWRGQNLLGFALMDVRDVLR